MIGAERFLAEIKTTANLQHPHILALLDSGKVDGPWSMADDDQASTMDHRPSTLLFYVMPFVEGESLRDRLLREKQLSIDDAFRITTRWPAPWATPTAGVWCTATSSPRTS